MKPLSSFTTICQVSNDMNPVVALIDCRLGLEVARHLSTRGDLVGLVVHPLSRRSYIDERHLNEFACWVETWPNGLDKIRHVSPKYILSVQFGFRLSCAWLKSASVAPLNLHPGYLPDNKGRATTAWPILDGSRAGVTLHVMNAAFDDGPYVARDEVPVYEEDTGQSLAERVEAAALCLFKQSWPKIDELQPREQESGGAYHSLSDIQNVRLSESEIGAVKKMRARSFRDRGVRYEADGHIYEARVIVSKVT